MKKLLLSVIAFALILTSCYKKDFKNVNQRLDALAAQVQGVATLAAGITTLQSNLAALQTAVGTIGTNVGTLQAGLTSLTTTVNTLSTNLNALSAAVAAGNTTTQGLINSLTTLVTNNQTAALAAINAVNSSLSTAISNAVTSINSSTAAAITAAQTALNNAITAAQGNINATTAAAITAAQNALTSLLNSSFANTDAAIANLSLQLSNAVTALNNSITAAVNAITLDNANQTTVLTALINAMLTQLAIANAQLATLVNSNNIFVGDLVINDEATLSFAESLGAKVRAITGNVTIDASTFTASQMARLKDVTNNTQTLPPPQQNPFIGTIVGNLTVSGTQAVDLSKLVTVSGDGVTTGSVTLSGANHNLSSLVSVKKDYSVSGSDVMDDALQTVGGNMTLNYPGAYSYPNLTTVNGVLTATSLVTTSALSFPALSSANVLNDGSNPNNVLQYNNASSINIGASASLQFLQTSASTVTLGEDVYTNGTLTVDAYWATTVTMGIVSINGGLNVWGGYALSSASTVNLNSLVTTTAGVYVATSSVVPGTANIPLFSANQPIQIEGPQTQTLASYSRNIITSASIRTLTLPVYRAQDNVGTQFDNVTALRTLTVGDARASITTTSFAGDGAAQLRNITVTSSVYAVQVNLNNMANLQTVSTSGLLQQLQLNNDPALISVTTAGNMDYLLLNNDDALTSVTVGHNYVASVLGQGTHIQVYDCDALTSFSSGTITGRLKSLDVRENNLLSSINFSSLNPGENITSGVVDMQIYNNRIGGTYTQSVFATNSAPVIAGTGLQTIKAYALNLLGSGAHAGSWIDFGFRAGGVGTDNSITTLDADATAFNTAGGYSNPSSASFVQRLGDNNGQGGSQELGSRINVARELGYVQ